jgi:hypothetical protein
MGGDGEPTIERRLGRFLDVSAGSGLLAWVLLLSLFHTLGGRDEIGRLSGGTLLFLWAMTIVLGLTTVLAFLEARLVRRAHGEMPLAERRRVNAAEAGLALWLCAGVTAFRLFLWRPDFPLSNPMLAVVYPYLAARLLLRIAARPLGLRRVPGGPAA